MPLPTTASVGTSNTADAAHLYGGTTENARFRFWCFGFTGAGSACDIHSAVPKFWPLGSFFGGGSCSLHCL